MFDIRRAKLRQSSSQNNGGSDNMLHSSQTSVSSYTELVDSSYNNSNKNRDEVETLPDSLNVEIKNNRPLNSESKEGEENADENTEEKKIEPKKKKQCYGLVHKLRNQIRVENHALIMEKISQVEHDTSRSCDLCKSLNLKGDFSIYTHTPILKTVNKKSNTTSKKDNCVFEIKHTAVSRYFAWQKNTLAYYEMFLHKNTYLLCNQCHVKKVYESLTS